MVPTLCFCAALAYETRGGKMAAQRGSGTMSNKRVLVVEDNELNLRLFCDLLTAHGYATEPVRDGRDALAKAKEFAPDLIIMDIQLPHVSGMDLIAALKGDMMLKAVPIMAVTAYAGRGDEERIRAAGAEGYVSKPISVIRFIEAVSEMA
jgi:two-component system, cell cycle response regulator DivK